MAKTRKHSSHRKMTMKLPRYAATMHGINKWQEHAFEKLGWMVLAKAKGYSEKVTQYKKMLDHLLKTIEHVKKEYESANKKHDLNVVHMNVECLKSFVMKNL